MITKAITIDQGCFQKRSMFGDVRFGFEKTVLSVHNFIYLN